MSRSSTAATSLLTARWEIPGVGRLRPRIDAVRILCSATVQSLKSQLPIGDLHRSSHKFEVITYNGREPRVRSVLKITGTADLSPFHLLAKHEALLGRYRIVKAEIAFDVRARARWIPVTSAEEDAREKMLFVIGILGKPRHVRRYLKSEYDPTATPKPGFISAPTFYFEHRKASVALKCYCRRSKRKGRGFGSPCLRIEWTLANKALRRYLGGNQISDLLNADPNKFAAENLRLETVDYLALGKLVSGARLSRRNLVSTTSISLPVKQRFSEPARLFKRTADAVLRKLAHDCVPKFNDFCPADAWVRALRVCSISPAQIRGFLKPPVARKRERPKKLTRTRTISPYRINACFQRIELRSV